VRREWRYDRRVPRARRSPTLSEQPSSDASRPADPAPGTPPGPPPKPSKPAGLREQAQRTIAAGRRLATAHVALARAELAVIVADAKQVAIRVGIALALVLYLGLLIPVGTALFLGEWLFGSMGWGILHGTLFCIATAFVLILGALRVSPRYLAGTLLVAVLIGVAVGTMLGLAWPNAAYAAIGESVAAGVDPAVRPLVVGIALWGAVLAFVGLLGGARLGGIGGALGGFVVGAIVGALVGSFTAISFSLQVGIALGVTAALIAWPILAALALRGYDPGELKRRFVPQASIDAARETMDFVQERLPGRKEDPE